MRNEIETKVTDWMRRIERAVPRCTIRQKLLLNFRLPVGGRSEERRGRTATRGRKMRGNGRRFRVY
jgi:hypothetical protein